MSLDGINGAGANQGIECQNTRLTRFCELLESNAI